MASRGFDTGIEVTIRIVDRPVTLHRVEAIATYDSRTAIITVPGLDHCCGPQTGQSLFGLAPDMDLWQSFVAHELAHAVADANFQMERPPRVSHEYIAYVVQFATMPSALRECILERFTTRAFAGERQINQHFMDLDPQIFAVKAYRHFLTLNDGAAFFARVLSGEFRRFERD